MDDKQLQAKKNYEKFCAALDKEEWHYTRHDDDLCITCGTRGKSLAIDMVIIADSDRYVLTVLSQLPFKIAEDKRVAAALAVAVANYGMSSGSFDYDLSDGEIRFRMTQSYRNSDLDEELLLAMLYTTCTTVDRYNDKFLCISTGVMDVKVFIEWENKED